MLVRLLRSYLVPYRRLVTAVVVPTAPQLRQHLLSPKLRLSKPVPQARHSQ